MAQATSFLRRALLYVPGSSQKMLQKSSLLRVDSLIYDLEDSVTPDLKATARDLVARHIAEEKNQARRGGTEISVRINAVETGLALEDLTYVIKNAGRNLDTIVVPKVQSAFDLKFVADVIRHVAPGRVPSAPPGLAGSQHHSRTLLAPKPLQIIGLIESATGLVNIHDICRAGRLLGLTGLAFAAEDFVLDLGLSKLADRREVLFARSSIVTACRAYEISSAIDMVSVNVSQKIGASDLEEECNEGRSLGFTGKQAIHPSQVDSIQRTFGPSKNDLEWAVRVQIGDVKAREEGRGAWKLDGKMIDAPVVNAANNLINKARACEIDVDAFFEKHRQ